MIHHCIVTRVFFAFVFPFAAGCGGTSDRGHVQREWSNSLRELGIVPIFPPREDVVVGDVYATRYNPDAATTLKIFDTPWNKLSEGDKQIRLEIGMSPRLARIQFHEEIASEYANTLSAPASSPDYNEILGNPALAAADEKVKAAEAKLKSLKNMVDAAKTKASDSQTAVLEATRAKEDSDTAVADADGKLAAARAVPIDTSTQELKLQQAKSKQRTSEDELIKRQHEFANAADEASKKTAAAAVTKAEQEKAVADLEVKRAQEDLDARKLAKPNVTTEENALKAAKEAQAGKAKELKDKQRTKENDEAKAKAIEEANKTPIEDATKAVDAAKAIQTAIAAAGAKMLYPQPRDAKSNVFTGMPLPHPKSGADDVANSRVNRLRLVGFPEFATASFTQGDLSALIPVEAMSVGINVSSTNVSKVSVKVPAAESYGLSLQAVVKKLFVAGAATDPKKYQLSDVARQFIDAAKIQTNDLISSCRKEQGKGDAGHSDIVYFRVITEVYYARALDISVLSANGFGTRVQVAAPNVPIGSQTSTTQPSNVPAMTPAALDSAAVGTTMTADVLAGLQARLGTTQTVPGGSVQLVNYSESSIGLRRVFDRPIAIGFRGLLIAYDVHLDELTQTGITGGSVPLAQPTSAK